MAEPPRKLKATEATGGNEANFSQNRNLAYAKQPSTSKNGKIEPDSPYAIFNAQLEKIKERIPKLSHKDGRMYDLQKSSLALVSQFSAENVEELITNKKWSVQDKQIFGEYVISILALAGLCHDTLKKDFKRHCLEKVSMNKMKNGRAKEYFVGFVDTKKIVFEILLKYFKTGYYLNIVNPTNDQDDYPFCFLEAQVESLKEFVASQKETFQTQYHQRKSSLALMSQFAAKNLIRNLIADKKWFEDERKMFGEYVISILALTGLCHDTLKDHFDRKQLPKNLVNKIRSGNAKEFLVGFCDAEDISYRIVQKYFKSTK